MFFCYTTSDHDWVRGKVLRVVISIKGDFVMKNFMRILYIVFAVVVMSGCSEKNTKEDYDFSIISKNKVSLF